MTEAEWNSCSDPQVMLEALRASGKLTERKAGLFIVACSRRTLHLFKYRPEHCRKALEVAERHALGEASADELHAALQATEGAFSWMLPGRFGPDSTNIAASNAANTVAYYVARFAAEQEHRQCWNRAREAECAAQATLLRCIFGPVLFRPLSPVAPAILVWNDGTVQRLAAAIYEERALPAGTLDNGRLAILADALEEADCDNEEVLSHLRQQGVSHYRGCWVIDLLLKKA
ncbi:MAG TPA: hypothetical protein VH575_11995 [Gemmataceae bacterium]